jgi:phosphoglycerate-specific signal transduction histidine kinase
MSLPHVLALCLCAVADAEGRKPSVPTYTNEDLRRVAPARGETGVLSVPATPPAARAPEPAPRGHGEEYWRRQSQRLRDRLDPLRERADELRARIEERRRLPGVRPYTDERIQAWQRRLDALQARIGELESRFEERARRDGALPGWLR